MAYDVQSPQLAHQHSDYGEQRAGNVNYLTSIDHLPPRDFVSSRGRIFIPSYAK